ncbi:sacsin-like [Clupea harengus]|uniref:Sacsin-like n=1 Tax=Clupea harengus TaxID=7950 RepID=A0A8M1KRP0_CLUHA|nr:sacsin-like [Clupea harengus]
MDNFTSSRKPDSIQLYGTHRNTFGATSPPFIDYLKDILRRYPDGGQILKELIQNADDAGASEVVFIHDERAYEKDSLWSEDLGKYQGPALYAFNNTVFTEEDWHGIQATGRSVKRDDPNRVGRFGIGFSSVYHITDVPCIFSSKYLGLLDPQEKIFGEGEGGFRWSLDDDEERKMLLTLRDQFKPLRDIVKQVSNSTWEKTIEEDQYFNGTLFRFPLRCESSEISDNLYDSDKVVQLFDSFIADADISLLFLRHVSNVSLMHINTCGSVAVRLKVSLSSSPACSDSGDTDPSEGSTVFKNISSASLSDGERNTQWLVTSYCLKEGEVTKIDSLAEKMCYQPKVDLAFPCDPDNCFSHGRLSCFLPLPNNESNRTGLPVQINASFGLTDNRRHIKWQDEDQKNDETAQWNELLMTDVLPHTYLKMILDSIQCCRNSILPATSVYRLWPDIVQMEHKEKWHRIAMDLLERLLDEKAVLSLAKDEKIWVTPLDAVFPANDIQEPVLTSAVARVLMAENENLINIPEHVVNDVKCVFPESDNLQWITPRFVRDVLHRGGLEEVSHNDKLSLLEYVLSDGNYQELEGLQLLPLNNGIFKKFTDSDECTAFIDNKEFPIELLPFCKEALIAQELSPKSLCHLRILATKETFKIINLDAHNVADLTKKHFPHEWKNGHDHVIWDVGNPDHPPRGWLIEFWKYLSSHWEELGHFINMPLIPVKSPESDSKSVLLARLQEKPTLVFQQSKHSSLSEQIQNVVKKVGGTVIKRDECLKHHDIETFVLPPSPKSLLKIFLNLSRDQVIRGIHSASCTEKEEIKFFLSSLDSLSNEERSIVSRMPLFQLMTGDYVCAESKRAVLLNSSPTIPSDLPIPNYVVQCATEADRRLSSMMKIELLDTAQLALLLVDCIETGSFNRENEKKTMIWILQHGFTLFTQNVMLHKKCKALTFIETEGECQKTRASNVFDPSNDTFKNLFEPNFFPSADYVMTPQMLQSLKQLDLQSKEKDISPKNVLDVVRNLEELHTHSQEEACKKADVLLKVLNDYDIISKFSPSQLEQLQKIHWFPCQNPHTVTKDLEERPEKKGFYKLCEITHSKYRTVVGHVMPLVAELNEKVCKQLGLLNPPPAEKVMENLSVLNSMAQTTPDLDKDIQFKTKLHDTYSFMQNHIGLFREVMKKNPVPWLWIDNHFVSPCDVVLAYPPELDLSSYIKKVPEEYSPFEVLLKEFGVKLNLSDDEIEEILHDVKERIDKRSPPFGEPSELRVSLNILNWMRKEQKPAKDDTLVPVMAENQNFAMQPASKSVVCDISKEGLADLEEHHEDFHVIHEEVPPVTTEWLRIPLLSTRILNPEYIGIEQCGQTEPITLRIKNILKEYDEDSDIFKELLQNAEDAGARTCRFMVDFRKHRDPPESLIDSGMSLCSGPCLWTFNDELFSDEDWENITRVGSASKEKKLEKIGKFGIGFNAVYHVTDVPSVLSGKNLLIFDPNVTHLKKFIQNKGNPGIKLNLFQRRIFRRFPGQFRSYEGIFDCDLSEINTGKFYKGTLIKLPFRSPEESTMSEISTKVYDTDHIMAFQQHLTHEAQTHLLFLKNIEHLSLQTLPENASTPPTKEQMKPLVQITRKVVDTVEISDGIRKDTQNNSLTSLMQHYTKCADVMDSSTASITEIIQNNVDGCDVQYWLLYSCFGTHSSLRMVQENYELNGSLPIGGIAVPLQKASQTGKWAAKKSSLTGQAFSFLPLSIQTGLPVNINGSFAVMSNRKCLWETGMKAEWNRALLKDAVTNAYITTLLVLKKLSENGSLSDYPYYTFWPDKEKVGKAFQPLVDAFYSEIVHGFCNEDLKLFSDGKKWYSLNYVRYLNPSITNHKKVGKLAEKIFLSQQNPAFCAVPLPSWVRQSMMKSGFKDIVKARTLNWTKFFQEVVFRNVDSLESQDRNAMILSAIDLNDDEVDELLKGHRIIPSKSSGELQYIRTVVNPSDKVACLYDQEEGRFLDGTRDDFCSPKRIQRLTALGMLSDHLPLEDIIERAGTISKVWETDQIKATKRLECLFDLMKELSVDKKSHDWCSLQNTPLIPACSPVNTLADNQVISALKKPYEVYNFSCRYLVNMTEFTVDHRALKIYADNSILEKLGVRQTPPLETVLRQLEEASKFDVRDHSLIARIANDSYEYLNKWLSDQEPPTLFDEFVKSFPLVLVEDKFVHVKSVAKCQEFEVKPYLYLLPSVLSKFSTLWECVGIQNQFTPQQFAAVLNEMESKYGSNPLSDTDLNICLDILTKGLLKTKEAISQNYLVPDENSMLRPSSDLHYNDSPWMPVSADITLCHQLIARGTARHFGVRTTRHHTLQHHLVDGFSPYAQEFGQHEKLTVRIKNIIEAYPSKKDIIKELIQNAEDAEATEIHFIWDKRKHGTEKTFGKNWNSLQGPALCVYTNKVFTDSDLQGIQKLGEGGKRGQCGKTGKYGLGFNSVYHLTDCPAILTGDEWLCISDPHVKYSELATIQLPGCKYSLENTFKDSFMDVYQTFLPSDFSLKSGTMFRLPLRTEEMAAQSEICKADVGDHHMEELLQVFAEDPDGLILFLKHIKKIQFHTISPDSDKLHTVYLIEKELSEKSSIKRAHFQNQVQVSQIPCQAIYDMHVSSSDSKHKRRSQWVVAEQFGSLAPTPDRDNEQSDVPRTPQAAVAACMGVKPDEPDFIGRLFCSLPLPGVTGLPVHINGNFEVDSSRRDLWKEDGESLKTTWNETLKLDVISPLYADLLKHIQMTIRTGNHLGVSTLGSQLDSSFLTFFPSISKDVKQEWHTVINHVYKSISERDLYVIPVLQRKLEDEEYATKYTVSWSNVCKHNPMDSPHFSEELPESLFAILEDIGMSVVPWSCQMDKISTGFTTAGVEVMMLCPGTVREYLKEKPLNDAMKTSATLPLPVDHTLIKDKKRCSSLLNFCMRDVDKKNVNSVKRLPLLLTQDQMLRVFDWDSPRLYSRCWDIFQGQKALFADDLIINLNHYEILEKGGYLQKLTIQIASKYLIPVLKDLVEHEGDPPAWLKQLWEFFDEQIQREVIKDGETKNTFNEIKKAFLDSPVLPVISQNNKQYLKTMRDLHSVVWKPTGEIASILVQLGLMTLYSKFFACLPEVLFKHLMPELLKTDNSNAVLDHVSQIPLSKFKLLSNKHLDKLQEFLQSGIGTAKKKQKYQRKLKSLPLFQTVQGERQCIEGHNGVFILKTECSERFPDLFSINKDGHIFLKYNLVNEHLSRNMDISILTDLDFYVKFLLPSLQTLTEAQVLDSIQLQLVLKQHPTYKKYHDQIVAELRTVRFIRDIHGTLQLTSYFFDEKEYLYKIMLPQEKFVPPKFWNIFDDEEISLRRLLKDLGMKCTVSDVEITEFAHTIESEAQGQTSVKELRKKSSALFKEALKYNATKKNSNLLNRIAAIKFVFPVQIQKDLCDYHQPLAGERDLVGIKGSLIEENSDHQYLIWSSMSILPTDRLPQSYLEHLKKAGAFHQPPSGLVAQNLRNICLSECPKNDLRNIRKTVFCKSYAYLQSKDFSASLLQKLPVVLVENDAVLVQASQAVLNLDDHNAFRPYLYRISPQHALYAEFFKRIGVEETPTIRQYSVVLKDIFMDSKGKETLNANQQSTMNRTVQHLFQLMKDQPEQIQFRETLYLPSADGKLYKSNVLYFNDTVFQKKRLEDSLKDKVRLLVNLVHCHLGTDMYKHQVMLKLLPEHIRPTMLSRVTSERLAGSRMKPCEYGESCEFSGSFKKHLSSRPFLHGLTCLIRQQSEGSISLDRAVELCQNTFGRLKITCCESLETELFFGDEPLANTASETQVYSTKETQGCTFYLKHRDDMASGVMYEVTTLLSKELNFLLENSLCPDYVCTLGQLLLCDTVEEIEKALEKYAIRNSAYKEEGHHHPDPGSPIPEEWHDTLDMNFMNNYERGEYVGFKKTSEDELYYYAVIVERLDVSSGTGQYCCRYKIQIGTNEFFEVSSLDLYQFKREKTSASQQNHCREIQLVDGHVPSHKKDLTQTLKSEIDQCLKEICTLSEEEQPKALRRLYLRWHPDKNPDQEKLANEAFKYIKNKYEEFKQHGLNTVKQQSSSSENYRGQNKSGQSSWSWDFKDFYDEWDSEAKRHRQGREHNSRPHYNFSSFHQEMPRPDKAEAKRWYLQAQCDLKAAHNDTGGESPEWCLFKVHQAVEKALMAAEYRRCGKSSPNCSISSLAQKVSGYCPELSALPGLVSRLKHLGVNAKTTQYPSYHTPPKIPNNTFQPENEKEVLDIASELLQKVDTYITN